MFDPKSTDWFHLACAIAAVRAGDLNVTEVEHLKPEKVSESNLSSTYSRICKSSEAAEFVTNPRTNTTTLEVFDGVLDMFELMLQADLTLNSVDEIRKASVWFSKHIDSAICGLLKSKGDIKRFWSRLLSLLQLLVENVINTETSSLLMCLCDSSYPLRVASIKMICKDIGPNSSYFTLRTVEALIVQLKGPDNWDWKTTQSFRVHYRG